MKGLLVFLALVALATSASVNSRIVGGQLALRGQFPYAVGIITQLPTGNGFCVGSLVSANYVLTAASCVSGVPSGIAVIGGLEITNPIEAGQRRLPINQFIIHPAYAGDNNDIALIRLPESIANTDTIRPVRLPNRRQVTQLFTNQLTTYCGWGRIAQTNPNVSQFLRFGRGPVMTNLACSVQFITNTIVAQQVCTNDAGQGAPCLGDNGAPVTITDADGITTQIGIHSYISILGCENDRPKVHTRVTEYLDWIGANSDVIIRNDF